HPKSLAEGRSALRLLSSQPAEDPFGPARATQPRRPSQLVVREDSKFHAVAACKSHKGEKLSKGDCHAELVGRAVPHRAAGVDDDGDRQLALDNILPGVWHFMAG